MYAVPDTNSIARTHCKRSRGAITHQCLAVRRAVRGSLSEQYLAHVRAPQVEGATRAALGERSPHHAAPGAFLRPKSRDAAVYTTRALGDDRFEQESTAYTPSPVRTIEIGALATACCQWAGTSSSLSPDERLGTSSSLSRGSATDEQLGTSSPLSRRSATGERLTPYSLYSEQQPPCVPRAVCNGAEVSIASGPPRTPSSPHRNRSLPDFRRNKGGQPNPPCTDPAARRSVSFDSPCPPRLDEPCRSCRSTTRTALSSKTLFGGRPCRTTADGRWPLQLHASNTRTDGSLASRHATGRPFRSPQLWTLC